MAAVVDSSPELEEFRRELVDLPASGEFPQVKRAEVEEITDSTGDAALHATVFVDAPPGDTWPFDEYMALREAINDVAQRIGFRVWVYVDLAADEASESQANGQGDDDRSAENQVDAQLTEDAAQEHDT